MSANELYQFTISNGVVTQVREFEHGGVEIKWIKPGTSFTVQGNQVIKTESKKGYQKITVYDDSDGDGFYQKLSSEKIPFTNSVTSSGSTGNTLGGATQGMIQFGDQKQFVFAPDGTISAIYESEQGWQKPDPLWKYLTVEAIDDLVLVQKISGKWEIYRDGNGDGYHTEVAEGYGDVHGIDLTGIVAATNDYLTLL